MIFLLYKITVISPKIFSDRGFVMWSLLEIKHKTDQKECSLHDVGDLWCEDSVVRKQAMKQEVRDIYEEKKRSRILNTQS